MNPGKTIQDQQGRRAWWIVAGTILGTAVVAPILLIGGWFLTGAYGDRYLARLERKAEASNLIGRPEAEIPVIFGQPSFIWDRGDPAAVKSFNYEPPPPGWSLEPFQIYCQGGVITGFGFDTEPRWAD